MRKSSLFKRNAASVTWWLCRESVVARPNTTVAQSLLNLGPSGKLSVALSSIHAQSSFALTALPINHYSHTEIVLKYS